DGEWSRIPFTVVVADGPAARTSNCVAGGDRDPSDIRIAGEVELPHSDRDPARDHRTDEAAPVDEAAARHERPHIMRDERDVIKLPTEQCPDDRGEEDVGDVVCLEGV